MKNLVKLISCLILICSISYFAGCGDSGGGALGKVYVVFKKTYDKTEANKYGKDNKRIITETEAKMNSIIKASNDVEIPFEQIAGNDTLTVKNIKMEEALWRPGFRAYIRFKLQVEVKEKIERPEYLKIVCAFVDINNQALKIDIFYGKNTGKSLELGDISDLLADVEIKTLGTLAKIIIKNVEFK